MGEPDERFETENAGTALDRMNGAEDGIDRVVDCFALANIREATSICCKASSHSSKTFF